MKKVLVTLMISVMTWVGVGMFSPVNVSAAGDCDKLFLTFRPWYYGLTDADCNIKIGQSEEEFTMFIWVIVLNILSDLFSAVGYLAIGFLIYGGYMYVLARGTPDKIAKGKKIIISAIVGLIICILAAVIVNTVVTIMIGAVGA